MKNKLMFLLISCSIGQVESGFRQFVTPKKVLAVTVGIPAAVTIVPATFFASQVNYGGGVSGVKLANGVDVTDDFKTFTRLTNHSLIGLTIVPATWYLLAKLAYKSRIAAK